MRDLITEGNHRGILVSAFFERGKSRHTVRQKPLSIQIPVLQRISSLRRKSMLKIGQNGSDYL